MAQMCYHCSTVDILSETEEILTVLVFAKMHWVFPYSTLPGFVQILLSVTFPHSIILYCNNVCLHHHLINY